MEWALLHITTNESMRDLGKMTKEVEKALKNSVTETLTLEPTSMVWSMEKANILGQMVRSTMENSRRESKRATEFGKEKTKTRTSVSGRKTIPMASVLTTGQEVTSMKGLGKHALDMAKAVMLLTMVTYTSVSTSTVMHQDLESTSGAMVTPTVATSKTTSRMDQDIGEKGKNQTATSTQECIRMTKSTDTVSSSGSQVHRIKATISKTRNKDTER